MVKMFVIAMGKCPLSEFLSSEHLISQNTVLLSEKRTDFLCASTYQVLHLFLSITKSLMNSTLQIIADLLELDGILNAGGASSVNGGGGSGGSVWVDVDMLTGLGKFMAEGGGSENIACGGGSGGRIGAYAKNSTFLGTYHAQGGVAPSEYGTGGPGSVFVEIGEGVTDKKISVDNTNEQTIHALVLNETALDLVFEELYLYHYAQVQMVADDKTRSITVASLLGDGTGLIKLEAGHTGTLERFQAGNNTESNLNVNFNIKKDGKAIFSEKTTLLGLFPTVLTLDGVIVGALTLIAAESRNIVVGPDARIKPLIETDQSKQQKFSFGKLQLDPGSSIIFVEDANMAVSDLLMKFNSTMSADYFNIIASNVDIGQEAEMTASGDDRSGSSGVDIDDGGGSTVDGIHYGGASHGGQGGWHIVCFFVVVVVVVVYFVQSKLVRLS